MKTLIRFTSVDLLIWTALIAAVISIDMYIGYRLVSIVVGIGCVLTCAIACGRNRKSSAGASQTFVFLAGGVSVALSFATEIFVNWAWPEDTKGSLIEPLRVATFKVIWSMIWIFMFAIGATFTYLLAMQRRRAVHKE